MNVPSRETFVADVPRRISTPRPLSDSRTWSLANGSSRSIRRGPRWTSVTFDPSAPQACAISAPTTPPPRIPRRGGTSCAVVALRFVHGCASRRPGMSGIVAVEPVATTTARRAVSGSCPSTSTCSFPVMRARPRTSVTWRFSSHGSWLLSSRLWITSSRRASTASASIGPATRPGTRATSFASSTGPEQRLRGHARVVRAVASDEPLLDDRHGHAVLAEPAGRHLTGRAGTDHHDVEFAHALPVVGSGLDVTAAARPSPRGGTPGP